jgi:formate hydrogenlyase subunit 4
MILLQGLIVLVAAPLLPGIINKTKAFAAGRVGPPVAQLYYDLAKLARKRTVLSGTTTWVFLFGPAVALAAALLAALMVPLAGGRAPIAFSGDVVLFVYLFALARFFTTAAALDTGSSFEGMGAAREVTFACLAEPALFFGFLALARLAGSLSISGLLAVGGNAWRSASAALVLVIASWFLVLLVECSRVPFDDPNTHLELTMIHEVMILDHSGPALGLSLYAGAVKLFVYSSLIARTILPRFDSPPAQLGLSLAAVLLLGVLIGAVESGMARLKLVRIPQLLVTASLIAAFAVVLALR